MKSVVSFLFPREMQADHAPLPSHPNGFLRLINHLEHVRYTRPGDSGSAIVQTFSGEAVFLGFFQSEFEIPVHLKLEAHQDCCWFVFPIWADPVWVVGADAYESTSYEQLGFFLPAGQHQVYLPEGRNWFYCIAAAGEYMKSMLNEFSGIADLKKVNDGGSRMPLTSCPLRGYTVDLFHQLSYNETTHLSLLLLIKQTIFSALKEYNRLLVNRQKPVVKQSELLYNKAIAYIRTCYMEEDLTPERVAGALYVSPTTLKRAFSHRLTTVKAFINFLRLMQARLWLQTTDMTLKEIAFAIHYTDEKYFVKAYRQRFMIHPKYRRDPMPGEEKL